MNMAVTIAATVESLRSELKEAQIKWIVDISNRFIRSGIRHLKIYYLLPIVSSPFKVEEISKG